MVAYVCLAVLIYLLGYRAGQKDSHGEVVTLLAVPRDFPGLDIPREVAPSLPDVRRRGPA